MKTSPTRAILLLVAALLASCGETPTDRASQAPLQEIPPPDLTSAQATVKSQIEESEARVSALSERKGDPAKLAEAYGELGLVYLTYSFLDAAEASFGNAASLRDDDYRWPYLLGYLFQIQGRLEEAEQVLERVLELAPGDVPTLIRLGTIDLERGRNDTARAHFEQVLAIEPELPAAINGLGRVAAATGDPERAAELFERVLDLQPQANSVRHALGLAYRALGDRERARLNLERGGDAPVLFADPVLLPVAQIGKTAELYLVRGAQAFSEERYAQAAEFYRRALEIDPQDFTTHKALGFCLEKLGDLEGAIAQLEEALGAGTTGDPARDELERSELYRIMGGLYVLQGRDREALEAFESALAIDPDRLDARLKLANALARNGQLEEALDQYDRILDELPENSDVLSKRATVLINLGRADAAIADFERAIATDDENGQLRLRYAEALEFLGRPTQAEVQRREATSLASRGEQRGDLLLTEARTLVRQGRLEPAMDRLREILAEDAGNTDARFELARILGHRGRYEEAVEEFAQVVRDVPWHRPARHGEVTALLLLGRYAEARARLEDGLDALPRDRALAHGLARLLASAPVDTVRDGQAALRLVRQLHAVGGGPETTATLAMAYAAAGEYEQAVLVQRQLVEQGGRQPDGNAQGRLEQRLAAFSAHQPWEVRSPDEIITAMITAEAPTGADSKNNRGDLQ